MAQGKRSAYIREQSSISGLWGMVQTGIWSGSTPHKFELFSQPRFPSPLPFSKLPSTLVPSQSDFTVAFLRILQEVSYCRPQHRSRKGLAFTREKYQQ